MSTNTIDDILNNFDKSTTPDVLMLYQVMAKTEEVMGFVLGVLVWCLVVGLLVVTALDIIYIYFPATRDSFNDVNKVSKIRFISHDAMNAVSQAYMGNGVSTQRLYFGKRVKTYLATAFILVLMISGTWQFILNFLIKIAGIFVQWLWYI